MGEDKVRGKEGDRAGDSGIHVTRDTGRDTVRDMGKDTEKN